MNLEETKKIIKNKIEAGELTREVRSQIKSYIDEKQNLREGFKETFKPLIETQEAVKASIDKEQNAMIEQLQKNQKALTEGPDKNRLAITSGFDKMDEVKRWDLDQVAGYEAIEEPKKPATEARKITYKISNKDLNKLAGFRLYDENEDAFFNEEELVDLKKRYKDEFEEELDLINDNYLTPDLIKLELVPKEKNDPKYTITLNDFF